MPVIGNFQLANGQAAYGAAAAATAAAVNVGLGFVPRYVKVLSFVAAGAVITEFVLGHATNQGIQSGVAPLAANGITVVRYCRQPAG